MSALLELADEEFASLRDRSQGVIASYRQDVDRGELDIPLNLDSLEEYLNEKEDPGWWVDLGLACGMEVPELGREWAMEIARDTDLVYFLRVLQAAGLSTIADLRDFLDRAKMVIADPLAGYSQRVEEQGGRVSAIVEVIWVITAVLLLKEELRHNREAAISEIENYFSNDVAAEVLKEQLTESP
jgi:hypothetical protein